MDEYLLDLADEAQVDVVGGKAHALGNMIRAGLRVPPGFVVISRAFQNMDSALQTEILQRYDDLQADFVAVRSSAISEDGAAAAWAGQLDTFLNTHRGNLIQNIKRCWNSINSIRAQTYAKEMGLDSGAVAVVIQKMIQSEVSGIAFSAHPVTKSTDHIVIEAGLGLGEAIVSGQITPDTYVVHKDKRLSEKHIALQTRKLSQSKEGATTWQALGTEGKDQKLSDGQIMKLSELIKRLERYFAHPVDVEWALHRGTFYILQSRPITTL